MTEVTSDLFCIASRLKKIDKNYKLFWNNAKNRYEVHTRSLEFVVPYDVLDVRTLEHARKTRKENSDEIEREIGMNNLEIANAAYKTMQRAQLDLCDMLKYANRAGHDVTFTKNKIKEF